jgi:NAD+ synthase
VIEARECGRACDRIAGFVKASLDASNRSGVGVAMSGGLDSSVAAALCVRGVGPERVVGFALPEKEGPPADLDDAELVARWLGIRLERHDMTRALREMGAYDFPISRVPGHALRAGVVRAAYGLRRMLSDEDPLAGSINGSRSAVVSVSAAHFKSRHRMRMVFLYFRAERMNLLVAGAANRTEKLTGIYTRFGVDDCADIMPIGGLYRTEVLRLAEVLGVPDSIRTKTPAPGIIPGVTDKYRYLLGLESERLDLVLEGLAAGCTPEEAAARCGIEAEHARRIACVVAAAARMAAVPLVPPLD